MDAAIRHRDSMLEHGDSYAEAMRHYYERTRGCYSYFYMGGPRIVPCNYPFPLPCPPQYADVPVDMSYGFGGGWDGGGWGGGGGWYDPFDLLLAQAYGSQY
jgi:hypothetical protein